MSIKARLGALERAESDGGVQVVFVDGGLPDPEPLTFEMGNQRLQQSAEETGQAFCERVRCLATQQRAKGVIVIGGLPVIRLGYHK